jgi:anti-sigma factor RsiW
MTPNAPDIAAPAEPLSAITLPDALAEPAAAKPEPPAATATVQPRWQRLRPLGAHAALFAIGIAGGLAVVTASSLTLRYLGGQPDRQLASARLALPPQPPEPLAVEIQKAKAELDAALNNRNGS